MPGNPLNREEIARLIEAEPPMIEDYVDLRAQLQPNGFDLSLREVAMLETRGQLGGSNESRVLSELRALAFGSDGWLSLERGAYAITFNEVVNLPSDVMALGRPRSSLLRSGVSLHTAVWDAGYRGRSQSLLTVHNAGGFRLQRDARLAQLVFFQAGYCSGGGLSVAASKARGCRLQAAVGLAIGVGEGFEEAVGRVLPDRWLR